MGGIVKGIEHAVSSVVGEVGSAMNTVTDGLSHIAGGVAGGILGKDVGDMVEKFAHIAAPIALTAFTGGIGGLGALGEAGGFLGPLQSVLGGGAEAVGSSLFPGLGGALTSIADSSFPFGNILGGLAQNLGEGGGIVSSLLGGGGGPGGLIGSLLGGAGGAGGFDLSKLLPSITNGAGGVLQGILGSLPQLGGLLGGGGNPLGILQNLPNLAQGFNPLDVLKSLQGGLSQLANQFPSISDALKNVLGQLQNVGQQPAGGLQDLLKNISSQLGQIPELKTPMQPFNPMAMLGIGGFANQFLQSLGQPQLPQSIIDQIGKAVQDAVQNAMKNVNPGSIPVQTPPFAHINPNIFQAIRDIGARQFTVAGGGAGAGAVGAGPSTPAGVLEAGAGGKEGIDNAFGKNLNSMNDTMNQIQNLDPKDPKYQQNLFQLQQQMNNLQQMQQMLIAMDKKQDEIADAIIRNMQA